MKKYNLALVGATGLVGRTFLNVLQEYDLPINELNLYASKKSLGKVLSYKNQGYVCKILDNSSYKNIDFAIFCAGKEVAKNYAQYFEKEGAVVIDNSSYYRMEKDIPLIVPEINMLEFYKSKRKIIANPNCSTIQVVLPLFAILKKYKIKRIIYNTYQSISGGGQKAIDQFNKLKNRIDEHYYTYDVTKTCLPHIDVFNESGYTNEEIKMVNETRKILNDESIKIASTCVRVPVLYSHAVSTLVEFYEDYDLNEIIDLLKMQEGIKLLDDYKNNIYPTSIHSTGNDFVYVGRIRRDISNDKGLLFYCTADNVRKGAASNVVQIIRKIINHV